MSKQNLIIIAVVVVLIAGIGGYLLLQGGDDLTPAERVMASMEKGMENEAVYASFTGNMSMDPEALSDLGMMSNDDEAIFEMINNMLENVTINGYVGMVMEDEDFIFEESVGLGYKGANLLDFSFFMENDTMGLMIPQLSDKSFTITLDEVMGMIDPNLSFDFEPYVTYLLSLRERELFEAEAYRQAGLDFLEEHVSEAGKEDGLDLFSIEMDMDAYMELMDAMMEIAKDDEDLIAAIEEIANDLLDILVETGDYQLMGLTMTDIDMAREELGNMEEGFEVLYDEFSNELEMALDNELDMEFSYEIVLGLTKDNTLKMMKMDQENQGVSISQTIKYESYDTDEVKGKLKAAKNQVSMLSLWQDRDALNNLIVEMADNAMENIVQSEALSTILSDVKVEAEVLPAEMKNEVLMGVESLEFGIQMLVLQYEQILPMLPELIDQYLDQMPMMY